MIPNLKTQAIGREAQGKIKPASILTEIAVLTKLLTEKDRDSVEELYENRSSIDFIDSYIDRNRRSAIYNNRFFYY